MKASEAKPAFVNEGDHAVDGDCCMLTGVASSMLWGALGKIAGNERLHWWFCILPIPTGLNGWAKGRVESPQDTDAYDAAGTWRVARSSEGTMRIRSCCPAGSQCKLWGICSPLPVRPLLYSSCLQIPSGAAPSSPVKHPYQQLISTQLLALAGFRS